MKDLAIAISAPMKTDDLSRVAAAVRSRFPGNFHLIVAASPPEAMKSPESLSIDDFITLPHITETESGISGDQVSLCSNLSTLRAMKAACGKAAQSDAPYTLHIGLEDLEAAWPDIPVLMKTMAEQKKRAAARGPGLGYYAPDCPLGSFDTSFFLFENEFAKKTGLWDFDAIDYLPHKISPQGVLGLLLTGRVGVRHILHYAGAPTETHTKTLIHEGERGLLGSLNRRYKSRFVRFSYPDSVWPRSLGRFYEKLMQGVPGTDGEIPSGVRLDPELPADEGTN